MKKTMWKTTFREIWQSLGRFLAIMAIVALGVGLFAGLKVTKPFMIKTAEDYLTEKNFYDFRLLSSYGFEEEDVEYFASQPDVRTAAGSYTFDILYEYGDEQSTGVMKTHSITEGVNGLEVLYGRMPENAQECVVDSRLFGEEALGQTIRLSDENEEDDLENFAEREFTIVGVVNASYYIQFERGNTSLGTGTVNGFMYLTPEAYDCEAYTEIFVKFDQDFALYSDEYDEFIEQKEDEWDVYLTTAADRRYQDIFEEANEELADAKEEFETEKADAEAELADAKQELDDAAVEIANGKQELADGKQEIADAKQEIADGYAEIAEKEQELADAEATLKEKEADLLSGEQEYLDGMAELESNGKKLDSGKTELNNARDQINAQEAELLQQEQVLLQQERVLLQQETELTTQENALLQQESELLASEEYLKQMYGDAVPADQAAAIEAGKQQIAEGKTQIETGKQQIADGKTQIEAGKAQIEEGKTQIADYKAEIDAGFRQIAGAKSQLDSAYMQLMDAHNQIETGKQQIADTKAEIEDGKQQIADAKKELADAERELADAEAEIADAEVELADGEAEYLDGLQEYEDGLKEFNEEIAEAEAEIADAEAEIADLEEPDTYLLGRDTNIGYMCMDSDSDIVADVAVVFPVFFFLVAALVCMTTMNRMIEEQRTQIGVLKALGYSNGTIMCKYLFYSGTAAFVGCVSGFLLGTFFLTKVIWTGYGIMYDMSSICFYIDWPIAIISLIVSLICSMGVTWYSCRVELKEVAASLMRPKAPRAGKRVFLERVPFIWKHLKFLQKVSIRNVLRYKKRFFMMVVGISGCTALLVTGFGIKDSISDVINIQYDEILLYDMSIAFQDVPDEEKHAECEAVMEGRAEQYTVALETSVDMQANDMIKSVSLIVPEEPEVLTEYINLHTTKGEQITYPAVNEAVITHKLADTMGVEIGDTIELVDEDHNILTVTVSAVNQNFVYNYVFLHPDTYKQQWQDLEFNTAYVKMSDTKKTDAHQLSADLMKLDGITNVTVSADVQDRFNNMLGSLDFIVFVIILCAAALAFIVLYNLTNINITERVREIATIKVLGFYKNETSTYVFRENLMLTTIGAIVGLLLGKLFHAFVMSCINIDMVAFDVRIKEISYVYGILLTFVFAWFVNKFMSGKIDRISMTESLKSVD